MLKTVACQHCRQSFTVQIVRPAPASSDTGPIPGLVETVEKPPAKKLTAEKPAPEKVSPKKSAKSPSDAPRAVSTEPTLEKLGRFELKNLLGAGGFAVVWRAYDPLLERHVALKLPRFSAEEEQQVRRFLNEAKTAGCCRV